MAGVSEAFANSTPEKKKPGNSESQGGGGLKPLTGGDAGFLTPFRDRRKDLSGKNLSGRRILPKHSFSAGFRHGMGGDPTGR